MSAGLWDFVIEQGATFTRTIQWEDEDGPVDPTGWTVAMQIRTLSGTLLVDLSSVDPPGGIELDSVAKRAIVTIPATVTALLNFKGARHDVLLVHPDGPQVDAIRLLEGEVDVSGAVTR